MLGCIFNLVEYKDFITCVLGVTSISSKKANTEIQWYLFVYYFGKDGPVYVCVGKMATVVLSLGAEFANRSKILPNVSVCEPNCSQTKTLMNLSTMFSNDRYLNFYLFLF